MQINRRYQTRHSIIMPFKPKCFLENAMQKIIRFVSDFLWNVRFTFADGARHKYFWKGEGSSFNIWQNSKLPDYYSDPKYQIMSCNIYNRK